MLLSQVSSFLRFSNHVQSQSRHMLSVISSPKPLSLSIISKISSLAPRSFSQREMAASTRQQPPWEVPQDPGPEVKLPPLKVWNSLTRSKTPFVPIDWENRRVTWYSCGPTVYDDAHLGHARNYVTIDILRRIMRDYFKFKLDFVMNITDIDDKVRFQGPGIKACRPQQ